MNYRLRKSDDKTIKQFMDRFYVLPKEDRNGDPYKYTKEELEVIKKHKLDLVSEKVKEGKDGYIVFRGTKPKKLSNEQCEEIKSSSLNQRELAKKYNVSVGTINKVKKGMY